MQNTFLPKLINYSKPKVINYDFPLTHLQTPDGIHSTRHTVSQHISEKLAMTTDAVHAALHFITIEH